ncbi:hypothetical protein [Trueperella sp. LYQ143]|uniref:hypothetical protein n=1 Tax=Trueperella sp. LYQ143 TaxID=3391059 RepID=UPI003983A99B
MVVFSSGSEQSMSTSYFVRRAGIFGLVSALMLSGSVFGMGQAPAHAAEPTVEPLTAQSAQKIVDGEVHWCGNDRNGLVDRLLVNHAPLQPDADDDGDGIANKDELGTFTKDGELCYAYTSHPLLADTDGDGITDKADAHPLMWDVQTRDAIMFQRVAYRDDIYLRNLFDPASNYSEKDWYEDNSEYGVMRLELTPYWDVVKTWHNQKDSFDAQLYAFSNKLYPFLQGNSTHMVAIRGTDGNKGDLGSDAALALGAWPRQGYDAQNLADEIFSNRYPNVYVTGHSLGGFLTQIFTVRSLGEKYGSPVYHKNFKDYRIDEPGQKYNSEFRRAYTFNAPKIRCTSSDWMCAYQAVGDVITQEMGSLHYRTANDSVTNITGAFEGAKTLDSSANGHGSKSFFEDKYIDIDGFSVGKRRGFDKGQGYQDPNIAHAGMIALTTVELRTQDGKTVSKKALAKTADELKALSPSTYLGDYTPVGEVAPLQVGEHRVIVVQERAYPVTYVFTDGNQEVARNEYMVKVGSQFTPPELPKSTNPDYSYSYSGNLPTPDTATLNAPQTYTIRLNRVPIYYTTYVKLVEAGTTVAEYAIQSKPSEGSTPIVLDDSKLPQGYQYVGTPGKLTANTVNTIAVEKKKYQVTFVYQDENGKELKTDQITVTHGSDAKYDLVLPDGYGVSKDATVTMPKNVTKDERVIIPCSPTAAEKVTVTIRYVDALTKTQIGDIITFQQAAGSIITVPAELPAHPQASEHRYYVVDPDYQLPDKPVYGDTAVQIPLRTGIAASNISAETKPTRHHVAVVYRDGDRDISTDQFDLPYGAHIPVAAPASNSGNYSYEDKYNHLSVRSSETIVVPLTFTPYTYTVTVKYMYGATEVPSTNNAPQSVRHGEKALITVPDPDTYQVDPQWVNPEITASQVLSVPLVKKAQPAPDTPQPVVTQYRVAVTYVYHGQKVGTENIMVASGGQPAYTLPSYPNEIGNPEQYFYTLPMDYEYPTITSDTELTVPLELTRVIEPRFSAKTLVDGVSAVAAESGSQPQAEISVAGGTHQIDADLSYYDLAAGEKYRVVTRLERINPDGSTTAATRVDTDGQSREIVITACYIAGTADATASTPNTAVPCDTDNSAGSGSREDDPGVIAHNTVAGSWKVTLGSLNIEPGRYLLAHHIITDIDADVTPREQWMSVADTKNRWLTFNVTPATAPAVIPATPQPVTPPATPATLPAAVHRGAAALPLTGTQLPIGLAVMLTLSGIALAILSRRHRS